jgi:DNA-binding transcriptional LysR family regulator
MLDRAALAEADLAAAAGTVAGRARIAGFHSALLRLALSAVEELARKAPRLECGLVEAEPEQALPALALGDVDLVLGDEWEHQPRAFSPALRREDLLTDPVRLVLPAGHRQAQPGGPVGLAALADEAWTAGHTDMGWEQVTRRACRELGGFEPAIRHRTNDATVSLALVARGHAVVLLPELVLGAPPAGAAVRRIAEGSVSRTIFAATRASDARRPSIQALLAAVREPAAALEPAAG